MYIYPPILSVSLATCGGVYVATFLQTQIGHMSRALKYSSTQPTYTHIRLNIVLVGDYYSNDDSSSVSV